MKLLLLLLLAGCGLALKGQFFVANGTGRYCKYLTHDYTLKECFHAGTGTPTDDIYNAVNIRKVEL